MKNFQQTPKQRRIAMTNNKHALVRSNKKQQFYKEHVYDSSPVNGVNIDLLIRKQEAAGHSGLIQTHYYSGFGMYCPF